MKKEDAGGIGSFLFAVFISDIRRGRAVTGSSSSSKSVKTFTPHTLLYVKDRHSCVKFEGDETPLIK